MSYVGNPKKPQAGQIAREVGRQTKKIVPDSRVRTNALYAQNISATSRAGVVVRRHAPIGECWVVQWDDIAPVQYFHESYLETES